ncbi:MAG: hypothetical protein PHT07_08645 [Paludibacter sp.]|nr:hypothetical protein [Paludibacter sp.]
MNAVLLVGALEWNKLPEILCKQWEQENNALINYQNTSTGF